MDCNEDKHSNKTLVKQNEKHAQGLMKEPNNRRKDELSSNIINTKYHQIQMKKNVNRTKYKARKIPVSDTHDYKQR